MGCQISHWQSRNAKAAKPAKPESERLPQLTMGKGVDTCDEKIGGCQRGAPLNKPRSRSLCFTHAPWLDAMLQTLAMVSDDLT